MTNQREENPSLQDYIDDGLIAACPEEAGVPPIVLSTLDIDKVPQAHVPSRQKLIDDIQEVIDSIKFSCGCGNDACKGLTRDQVNIQSVTSPIAQKDWVIRKGSRDCYEAVAELIQAHHSPPKLEQ